MDREIRIVEVGPRDGLQNEPTPIPIDLKTDFIERLVASGLVHIEATSFVSPKWVPQLSDSAELWPRLPDGGVYSALVPNAKGLERALELGVERIAVFTAASEEFTQKNINMSIGESITTFRQVVADFRVAVPRGWVRGYVSAAFECPFSGRVDPEKTLEVCNLLASEVGVDELSIGDTIGVATPSEVGNLAGLLVNDYAGEIGHVAWHFHDTRGTAIANVAAALEWDVFRIFDSSAGGLGGCPYAPGAGGNLATEDLVYFLEREGYATGVDLETLARASLPVLELLGRQPAAKAQVAALALASR
ncbi:MAG: hydroxymethylglutaryl-CoA lyase [Armatimonadetes bacterium]|nr:hydroxymethylglutaryl-CoA lyase [Armatimonadota bacterium]